MEVISEMTQGVIAYLMNQTAESDMPDGEVTHSVAFCRFRFVDNLLWLTTLRLGVLSEAGVSFMPCPFVFIVLPHIVLPMVLLELK
mgnify:CR=1 FL=1